MCLTPQSSHPAYWVSLPCGRTVHLSPWFLLSMLTTALSPPIWRSSPQPTVRSMQPRRTQRIWCWISSGISHPNECSRDRERGLPALSLLLRRVMITATCSHLFLQEGSSGLHGQESAPGHQVLESPLPRFRSQSASTICRCA